MSVCEAISCCKTLKSSVLPDITFTWSTKRVNPDLRLLKKRSTAPLPPEATIAGRAKPLAIIDNWASARLRVV